MRWLPVGLGVASLLAGAPGGAQTPEPLDGDCVISAFNRTAPVLADGSWVLPDVPTALGPVRIRATCVRDGETSSGQSSLVTVPLDDVVLVPDIQFEQPIAIPQRLALSARGKVLGDSRISDTRRLRALPVEVKLLSSGRVSA